MGLFTSFQLRARDADTRRRAVEKLGARGKASSIPDIEPLLNDPDWSVREGAARALGGIAEPAVVAPLLAALRAADELRDVEGAAAVRRAVVEALTRVGTGAVPTLLEAMHDRQPRLREAAIEALGGIGGAESMSALSGALSDDRSNVRQAAAAALGRAGGNDAVAALTGALSHKDPGTRRAAAIALGSLPPEDAVGGLRMAAADRDRTVREAAIKSLVALASPAAVGALCQVLLGADRDARPAAAAALRGFAWSPTDGPQRIVHAVLNGRYSEAAREGEAAVEPLTAALADREAATRRGAAEALGQIADPRAAAALSPLLGDQDAGVREAAVRALVALGPPAYEQLVRALDERDGVAREAATRALAGAGEGAVAAALADRLQAGEPMSHAGATLRVVGTREALDAARLAADLLAILTDQAGRRLPTATLERIAALEDVMRIEPGRVPDPDERVACEALRHAARRLAQGRT